MAAISCTLTQLCNAGDAIVASNTVYGGTHALLTELLPLKMNVHTSMVDITNLGEVRAALEAAKGSVRVLYTEVLANPTLKVADIPALSNLAHEFGAKLVVDNTFTPCVVTPMNLGADIVVHSVTKFVNGTHRLAPCV